MHVQLSTSQKKKVGQVKRQQKPAVWKHRARQRKGAFKIVNSACSSWKVSYSDSILRYQHIIAGAKGPYGAYFQVTRQRRRWGRKTLDTLTHSLREPVTILHVTSERLRRPRGEEKGLRSSGRDSGRRDVTTEGPRASERAHTHRHTDAPTCALRDTRTPILEIWTRAGGLSRRTVFSPVGKGGPSRTLGLQSAWLGTSWRNHGRAKDTCIHADREKEKIGKSYIQISLSLWGTEERERERERETGVLWCPGPVWLWIDNNGSD